MFQVGDLVLISKDHAIKYYAGKTAIVATYVGMDDLDQTLSHYYRVHFDDGTEHIFAHLEMKLLSER